MHSATNGKPRLCVVGPLVGRNPGYVTTRQVVEMLKTLVRPVRRFEFWENDEEFYRVAAKTPRSNCVLSADKLLSTGVTLRSVEAALRDALSNWKAQT